MLVENNLVYKTADYTGTQWWVEFIDVGSNCTFRNNTFYEAVTMVFAQSATGTGITIRNNIFAKGLELDDFGATNSSIGRTSKWDNINEGNNLYSFLVARGCGYQCKYTSFSSASNSVVGGSYTVGTMFASGESKYPYTGPYPFQLVAGSKAINFASASYAPATDMLGNGRVGAPDTGCYEYGGTPGGGGNQPPVANAGPDQTVTDTDGNGSQPVTLNGGGSTDAGGSITSYVWTENGSQIATGVSPVVTLTTGTHTVTLKVTDNGGLTATDTVTITVNATAVDTTPPSVVSVSGMTNSVTVLFSEPVTAASAQTVSNYTINNSVTVTQAVLAADSKTVSLATSAQVNGNSYSITIRNISDTAGNRLTSAVMSYTVSTNLVGYWKFSENAGTTARDSSGQNNNGILVNSPVWTGYGELSFNGSNSYVNCGTAASLNLTGSFTICASINPKSFGESGLGKIVDKGTTTTGFTFYMQQDTSSLSFKAQGGSIIYSDTGSIKLNDWQHVAMVYDKIAGQVSFYVDGQPKGVSSYVTAPLSSASNPLSIGIRTSDLLRCFNGSIDNVRIYNRALSMAEITNVYGTDYPALFYPIGDKTVDENSTLTFTVQTRDPNVKVSVSDSNLPSPPSMTNNKFNWKPAYGCGGHYEATFATPHGQDEDFETIAITVNTANKPPVFSPIGNKTINENSLLTFTAVATDPDGDAITYSVLNLPVGATFSGNTFSWTPATGRTGTYQVTFVASDGSHSVTQSVTITVTQTPSNSNGLAGYWKFDEASGGTTQDASGSGNTGTLVNNPSWTNGKSGNALNFNRTNSYVNCGAASSLNLTGSISIDTWINPRSLLAGNYGRLVDKGTASTGYSFFLDESTRSLMFVIYGGPLVKSNSLVVNTGTWQRATVVYNQPSNTVTFYLNGANVGSASYTTSPVSSSTPLVIGLRSSDLTRAYDGLIDEVKVYNRALSGPEIGSNSNSPPVFAAINNKTVNENSLLTFIVTATDPDGDAITYSAQNLPAGATFSGNTFSWTPAIGKAGTYQVTFAASDSLHTVSQPITITVQSTISQSGLVGYWKFDETSGISAQDSSGTGNTGTLVNGAARATGYTGNGINFIMTTAYVNCGTASNLNLTGSMTIDAWIYPRSFGQSGLGKIVDKGTATTGFTFYMQQDTSSLSFKAQSGAIVNSAKNSIKLNAWQRVTLVYNQASNTVTFYVNAVSAGLFSYANRPLAASFNPLAIGNRGYDLLRSFDGVIDEVKVYNRALSSSEL
jgi:hypothetical protein